MTYWNGGYSSCWKVISLLLLCSHFSKHGEQEFIFMASLTELRTLWFTYINYLSVCSLTLMLRLPSRFCSFHGEEGDLQTAPQPCSCLQPGSFPATTEPEGIEGRVTLYFCRNSISGRKWAAWASFPSQPSDYWLFSKFYDFCKKGALVDFY